MAWGACAAAAWAGDVRIDWPELSAFKRTFTDPITRMLEHSYSEKGIDTFHGRARFTDRNMMAVDGTALEGRHFLIAAGAEPITLKVPGADHLVTHEEFLALESLPRRIVLVGGGYIAAEFAHIAARAGAQVTIVQRDERMLKHFDPDLVSWLMEKFSRDWRRRAYPDGLSRRSRRQMPGSRSDPSRKVTQACSRPISWSTRPAERRHSRCSISTPLVSWWRNARLKLNEFLQSVSNPAAYAAGDAAQLGPPLTPVVEPRSKGGRCQLTGRQPPSAELPWRAECRFLRYHRLPRSD